MQIILCIYSKMGGPNEREEGVAEWTKLNLRRRLLCHCFSSHALYVLSSHQVEDKSDISDPQNQAPTIRCFLTGRGRTPATPAFAPTIGGLLAPFMGETSGGAA